MLMPEAAQKTDELTALKQELAVAIGAAADLPALDSVRVKALGKQGKITELMKTLGSLAPEQRKERGAALNILKDEIAAQIEARQQQLSQTQLNTRLEKERIDVTLTS